MTGIYTSPISSSLIPLDDSIEPLLSKAGKCGGCQRPLMLDFDLIKDRAGV